VLKKRNNITRLERQFISELTILQGIEHNIKNDEKLTYEEVMQHLPFLIINLMYVIFKENKYYTKWFADRIKYFNLESSAAISVKGMQIWYTYIHSN
jgi:hypothetical protein